MAVDAQNEHPVNVKVYSICRSIVGITNHMAQWSRPDTHNAKCEVSQFVQPSTPSCIETNECMIHCITTKTVVTPLSLIILENGKERAMTSLISLVRVIQNV